MKKWCYVMVVLMSCFCLMSCSSESVNDQKNRINQLYEQITEQQNEIIRLQEQAEQYRRELEELTDKLQNQNQKLELAEKRAENFAGMPIKFTEERPVYQKNENANTLVSFYNRNMGENADAFDAFLQYYNKDFYPKVDGDFYLFNPADKEIGWIPHLREKEYSVLVSDEQTFSNPMICERMMIYDEILGDSTAFRYEGYEGGTDWSLYFTMLLAPVSKDIKIRKGDFRIKFGSTDSSDFLRETYMNLYFGDVCFGTCFYETQAYVSHTWLEKYLKERIFKGGDTVELT